MDHYFISDDGAQHFRGLVAIACPTTDGGVILLSEEEAARRPSPDAKWDTEAEAWTIPQSGDTHSS